MSDEEQRGAEAAAAEAPALDALESESESEGGPAPGAGDINLDLLMDVSVTLSVEIGRSRMPIKELLGLNQGSVIELQRDINDPLDLMVNGTLIARGEVVESNGKFGLRLIDVVSPAERLKKLK